MLGRLLQRDREILLQSADAVEHGVAVGIELSLIHISGRTKQKESRNKAADALFISPRYLANIENKGASIPL